MGKTAEAILAEWKGKAEAAEGKARAAERAGGDKGAAPYYLMPVLPSGGRSTTLRGALAAARRLADKSGLDVVVWFERGAGRIDLVRTVRPRKGRQAKH